MSAYIDGRIKTNLIGVAFNVLKSKYDIGKDMLTKFGIEVTPTDDKTNRPTLKLNLEDFSKLDLPVKSYEEMIETMVLEIKNIGDNYPR